MKKLITLSLFVFAMILGTHTMVAQNTLEINAEASEKTEALRKQIKFSTEQRDQVYEVYKDFLTKKAKLENSNITDEGAVSKLYTYLDYKMKEILTEEQFEKFKSISED